MAKIVIACDSYKGCLTSKEVNEMLAQAFLHQDALVDVPQIVTLQMSDGGEGMLDAFLSAIKGERVRILAHDALMRRIETEYGVVSLSPNPFFHHQEKANVAVAIIEIAQTAGLHLIEPEQRNPMKATSWGVGEMVMHAYHRGIRHIIIGLGGSATSDCGIGMLKAMGDDWKKVCQDCHFVLASDVTNPLCGTNGAAYIFAPQKGADADMVEMLDARARRFAEISSKHFSYDMSNMPGAGAAGGLGYAFLQYFHAEFHSGADLLLDAMRFDQMIADADLVVTGEGHSDQQTLMGKLPMRILEHTQKSHSQIWLVSGGVSHREELLAAGFDKVMAVTPADMPLEKAMNPEVAKQLLRQLSL